MKPRFPAGLAVAVVAVLLITASAPMPTRAGLNCDPLMVSSPSSPIPKQFTHVLVGEDVLFEARFPPNAAVNVEFTHSAVLVEQTVMTAEADGSLSFVRVFEPTEIIDWAVTVEAPEICGSIVSLIVEPAGPNGPVGVATYICPDEIQTADDLAAAGGPDACEIALLPADNVGIGALPVEFLIQLFSSDNFTRTNHTATLDIDDACDPVTTACMFGLAYRWDYVAAGSALLHLTKIAGYRPGHITVATNTTVPQPIAANVDLEGFQVSFDVPADESPALVEVFWFADVTAPPPPPPPEEPPEEPLPDTAMAAPEASEQAPVRCHC